MLGAAENSQLLQHVSAQLVLWQHAADSFLDQHFRAMFPSFDSRADLTPPWEASVSVIFLLGHLGCGLRLRMEEGRARLGVTTRRRARV